MAKKPTTFGLRPDKLARLLGVCSDEGMNETEKTLDEQKAEMLQDLLAGVLPPSSTKIASLRKELIKLYSMSGIAKSDPIRDLLQNPKTDIKHLERIKDRTKKLSQSATSEAEHDTANVVYYAAIASGILFHDKKITKFSYKDLIESFSVISEEDWIPDYLIDLFKRACKLCMNKTKTKK